MSLLSSIQSQRDKRLHPTVASYLSRVSVAAQPTRRLSGFFWDIDKFDIPYDVMWLGRDEFVNISGTVYPAVFGPDGTVGAGVINTATGMRVQGSTDETFVFNTPAAMKGTALTGFSMTVVAKATGAQNITPVLASLNSGGSLRGPDLQMETAGDKEPSTYMTQTGAAVAGGGRSHFQPGKVHNKFQLYSAQAVTRLGGLRRVPTHGFNSDLGSAITTNAVWQNNSTGVLGRARSGGNPLVGEISFAMMSATPLVETQEDALLNSLVKWGIASLDYPSSNILIGDSMTNGSSGASADVSRSVQMFVLLSSGWQGSAYLNRAEGGEGIATQEALFQSALLKQARLSDLPNWYFWFWGGYNTTVFNTGPDSEVYALVDRYIAMHAECAARGIKTVAWRSICPAGVVIGDAYYQRYLLFNEYYEEQLALLPGTHIWFDWRPGFPANDFDPGASRNATFFADSIHLTAAAQEALCAYFLLLHPNP